MLQLTIVLIDSWSATVKWFCQFICHLSELRVVSKCFILLFSDIRLPTLLWPFKNWMRSTQARLASALEMGSYRLAKKQLVCSYSSLAEDLGPYYVSNSHFSALNYVVDKEADLPLSRAQIFSLARSAKRERQIFYVFCGKSERVSQSSSFARGATTGTGNEKRRTLRKSNRGVEWYGGMQ